MSWITPPKGIANSKYVAAVNDGFQEGFDYKYDVELTPDWEFGSGRMEGCNSARFRAKREMRKEI